MKPAGEEKARARGIYQPEDITDFLHNLRIKLEIKLSKIFHLLIPL